MTPIFARETLAGWEEAAPLTLANHAETGHYSDVPLRLMKEAYEHMEKVGALRVFSAREREKGALIGYSIYFVAPNHHYRQLVVATQDVVFIDPAHRGFGGRFIEWIDEQLKNEGVQCVVRSVNVKHDFSPMLLRRGYELAAREYWRRF